MLEHPYARGWVRTRYGALAADRVQPHRSRPADVPLRDTLVAGVSDVDDGPVRAEVDVIGKVELPSAVAAGQAVAQPHRRRVRRPGAAVADVVGLDLVVLVVGHPDPAARSASHVARG